LLAAQGTKISQRESTDKEASQKLSGMKGDKRASDRGK
jgi:hypothetical protein